MRTPSARAIAPRPSITAWPSTEQKGRFAALAESRGVSESKLLGLLIETVLAENPVRRSAPARSKPVELEDASDRLTIRLRPGDSAALERRATARGLKPSSYLAALTRAHLGAGSVLTPRELQALERSLAQVSATNRLLHQIESGLRQQGVADRALLAELRQVKAAVVDAVDASRALVKSAVESWEAPSV